MDEALRSALKESAATSVVHTVGQRVFLHNLDCKGATWLEHVLYIYCTLDVSKVYIANSCLASV